MVVIVVEKNRRLVLWFERLRMASCPSALHNSGERFDPPRCHEKTRKAILDLFIDWASRKTKTGTFVIWLHGPAGAGKSAIAQTLAELCFARKLLLASFAFSRTDSRRNNHIALIATLVYQAVLAIPDILVLVEKAIEQNPMIFEQNMETQISVLLAQPLLQFLSSPDCQNRIPPLVIIDGIDECEGEGAQTAILDVIFKLFRRYPDIPVIFLICSRPEQAITQVFESRDDPPWPKMERFDLHENFESDKDIRQFLDSTFTDIKTRHKLRNMIPDNWPGSNVVDVLVNKSSRQFIYASIVANYVSSMRHKPTERLKVILGIIPAPNDKDMPFADLDALYSHLLSCVEEGDVKTVLNILGILVLAKAGKGSKTVEGIRAHDSEFQFAKNTRGIEILLELEEGEVTLRLLDLASIIHCSEDGKIGVLHASLADYLLDERRSKVYHINKELFYERLSRKLLIQLDRRTHDEATRFAYTFLTTHLADAKLTPRLKEAILHLSLLDIYTWSLRKSRGFLSKMPFRVMLIKFMTLLHEMGEKKAAPELFQHHKSAVDASPEISALKRRNPICELYLLETIYHLIVCEYLFGPHYEWERRRTPINKITKRISKEGRIGFWNIVWEPDSIDAYIKLREHLADRATFGDTYPTEARYAHAAKLCLKYLCEDGYQHITDPPKKGNDAPFKEMREIASENLTFFLDDACKSDELISYVHQAEFHLKYSTLLNRGVEWVLDVAEAIQRYIAVSTKF
ncbi:unnamed protein product [Cyclocybe aegerita]|uniref:Nephrocystin 3-like N-terminal domain-containing protein n=1 Tax=Cyclocybe aegerita TaxID=1973307 RepID=A0A8S0VR62_CYCAE|nr:unnamed protein product [Cyclocybe aegerita]